MRTAGPGTILDLVDDSKRLGCPLTERAIRDWVEKGLIDYPERGPGRGRGAGSDRALFSVNQRQLFQSLLPHRAQKVSPKLLANLPVFLWLYYGDSYASIGQVRRAMRTWAPDARTSIRQASAAAAELVQQFASPRATDTERRKLKRLVVEAATRTNTNADELHDALHAVMDPDDAGRANVLPTADFFINHVKCRIQTVQSLEDLSDTTFIIARLRHRMHMQQYIKRDRTALLQVADNELKHMFNEPDAESMVNSSCSHLLALLALTLEYPEGPPHY